MAGTTSTKSLEGADAQRKKATLDMLRKKRHVEKTITLGVSTDDGTVEEVELTFRSIGSAAYDRLVSKFPPTREQKAEGLNYNMDKFAPALISACAADPEMSEDEAKEIWESDAWNRGELMTLFMTAVEVNTRGLDIPFSESG